MSGPISGCHCRMIDLNVRSTHVFGAERRERLDKCAGIGCTLSS